MDVTVHTSMYIIEHSTFTDSKTRQFIYILYIQGYKVIIKDVQIWSSVDWYRENYVHCRTEKKWAQLLELCDVRVSCLLKCRCFPWPAQGRLPFCTLEKQERSQGLVKKKRKIELSNQIIYVSGRIQTPSLQYKMLKHYQGASYTKGSEFESC